MTTALNIITRALRLIGVQAPGQSLGASEAQDGLTALNSMVNAWAAQRLTMVVESRQVFDLVSGTQTYTIGDGGDFDTVRPIYLPRASVISNDNASQPLELVLQILSTQQWQENLPVKAVTSALPTMLYYDFAFPLGNISLWPIPNVSNLDLALYTPVPLVEFADLSTSYNLPPGADEALTYQLTFRLAPEYGRPVPQEVAILAAQTFAVYKRSNIRIEELRVDPALQRRAEGGLWNWRTDQGA